MRHKCKKISPEDKEWYKDEYVISQMRTTYPVKLDGVWQLMVAGELWIRILWCPYCGERLVNEEVYVAEIREIDSCIRIGIFDSEYKAFLACMKDWKERKKYVATKEMFEENEDDDFIKRHIKWVRMDYIKSLRKYHITKEEVR